MKNLITFEGNNYELEFPDDKINDSNEISLFFKENSDKMGLDKLNKYYLNENLAFLCGSGTSRILGGRTINNGDSPFEDIINELSKTKDNINEKIIEILNEGILLEKKFDKINQFALFMENIENKTNESKRIKKTLDLILSKFVDCFIPFPNEYIEDKLSLHELFIKKIISRSENLNRPKIFTPNYDLGFENACERIGVSYNNGFRGTHLRKFDPDTFHNESYIKQESKSKGRQIGNYLNIYKLHGSISWQYNSKLNDLYSLVEVQIDDDYKKEDFKTESLMIFPLQTKKSYSLDLPYSELFRLFSKSLLDNQNTLVILGYSFLDEHINDIIKTGLYNPNLTLIIHSYSLISEDSPQFLKTLKNRSLDDHRIQIYEGNLVGSFENAVKYLNPLNSYIPSKDLIIETLKELLKSR
ncbi:MAG: SIR2 family protein [Bacteroidales bacterium]|nr:SIR2 family protein [Bacteroidales bacterium]